MSDYIVDDWHNLYGESWTGEIVPDSFAHPAKYSRGLIRHIYRHMEGEGWLSEGDVVLDPFGGVGLGGIDSTRNGLRWIGLELERDFVIMCHRTFHELARKEWCIWCICGEHGRAYLRAMQQSFSEKIGRGQSQEEIEVRPILQSSVQQQISLYGKEPESRTQSESSRKDTLEQGSSAFQGNETENIGESKVEDREEESELERGTVYSERRIYSDTGGQKIQDGARTHDGETSWPPDVSNRGSSSQERRQTGQQTGEFGSDDNLGTHEVASSERNNTESQAKDVCDLRDGVYGSPQCETMQRAVQAATQSRIFSQARRKKEGRFCQECGKLIVAFPILAQGDSRKLVEVLTEIDANTIVSSPPYDKDVMKQSRPADKKDGRSFETKFSKSDLHGRRYSDSPDNLGNLPTGDIDGVISSPPYRGGGHHHGQTDAWNANERGHGVDKENMGYGKSEGQLENMPSGDINGVISSPPYAESVGSDDPDKRGGLFRDPKRREDKTLTATYGETDGQLGGMKGEGFDGVVSSPPFRTETQGAGINKPDRRPETFRGVLKDGTLEMGDADGNLGQMKNGDGVDSVVSSPPYEGSDQNYSAGWKRIDNEKLPKGSKRENTRQQFADYGNTDGQLGIDSGDTFWSAARLIVQQCYQVLRPGGHCVWVVKSFVRKKKIVDFPDQWRQLCESVGFRTVHIHRAWLVEHKGAQYDLFGELHEKTIKRSSFFRRLHEKKYPHLAIDYEIVLCLEKPSEKT